jgi:LacI family transcriptional regulator
MIKMVAQFMKSASGKRNVTLVDVAKAAGVATMTVSRYLNEHPNVTEKTARKVKAAIDALGYRPNVAARLLMGRPSRVIGLIIPNLDNPFFSSIAHKVQQTAHARGYLVWIAATNDRAEKDIELIEQMRDYQVDGILLTASPETKLRPSVLGDVPLVALDRPVHGVVADFVTIEDRQIARQAVDHLIGHGYKHIACFGLPPNIEPIRDRILGYREAMHSHGLTPLKYVECQDKLSAHRVIKRVLSGKTPVQAIFPANGAASILALEALHTLGYSIPKEVAFLSYGDLPLGHLLPSPISAVVQPSSQLGERATEFLLDRIANKKPGAGLRLSIPASLVLRASCGCSPSKDGR